MMSDELLYALKPIEEEFNVELFTFEEALEFYKSDIENFKMLVKQFQQITKNRAANPDYLKGIVDGLNQANKIVDMVFGGRLEEGF